MPAARQREPQGRTLAPPAKIDGYDGQALCAAKVIALPDVRRRVGQDDAWVALSVEGL